MAAPQRGRMPLNAGDGGYGAAPGAGLLGEEHSESTPLLAARDPYQWKPLTSEELEVAAGGPGWKKMRCYLIAVFWLVWLAMLAGSVAVVVLSPRPVVTSLTWWQKSLFYQVQPSQFMVKDADESSGFRGEGKPCVSYKLNLYFPLQPRFPKTFPLGFKRAWPAT